MARKPTLSPSKLSTYLACPVKYKWTYVDERGRWYRRSRKQFSFGTSLHAVLQRFHDSGDAGVETVAQATAALEENWIEAGYSSQDEMMQALDEGKEILERYIETYAAEPVTAKTLFVEKTLRLDLGEFELLGRLDRVDETDDGSLEVVDYKTGRTQVEADDVATDLAMGCYQLLLRAHHGGRHVRARIVAVRTGASATASMTDSEARQFRDDLVALGHDVLHRDYEGLVPVGKPLCLDCDFLALCKQHPEFTAPEASSPPGTSPPVAP
jgi:RecB family exonuclease